MRCPLRVPAGLAGQLHAAALHDGPLSIVDPFEQDVVGSLSLRLLLGSRQQLSRSQRLLDAVVSIQCAARAAAAAARALLPPRPGPQHVLERARASAPGRARAGAPLPPPQHRKRVVRVLPAERAGEEEEEAAEARLLRSEP